MKKHRLNKGFTIIDAMIASALFIVTVSSVVRVMSIASFQLSHQKKMVQGVSISEGVIEELLLAYSNSSTSLSTGHHGPKCYDVTGKIAACTSAVFEASWDVVNDVPLTGMIQMTVRTTWTESNGRNQEVKFVTYRD